MNKVKEFIEALKTRHQVGFEPDSYFYVDHKRYALLVAYHYSSTGKVRVVYGDDLELYEIFFKSIEDFKEAIFPKAYHTEEAVQELKEYLKENEH